MSTTYPSDLSDSEWACVQRYLPSLPARGRPRTHSLRLILDAIFYVLRTGCAWRYLPCNFPPWPTVFYHFRRMRLRGTWSLLLPPVTSQRGPRSLYDLSHSYMAHRIFWLEIHREANNHEELLGGGEEEARSF